MDKLKATFKLFKDCKNSRRFKTEDDKFPIQDVYVMRPWSDSKLEFTLCIEDSTTDQPA